MSLAFVGAGTAFNSTNTGFPNFYTVTEQYQLSTHFSPILGVSPQAGDVAYFSVLTTGGTVSGLTGWTQIANAAVGSSRWQVYEKQLTAGDITTTWTVTYNTPSPHSSAFSLIRGSAVVPATVTGTVNASTGVTQATCPSIHVPQYGDILYLVVGTNDNSNQYASWPLSSSNGTPGPIFQQAGGDGRSQAFATKSILAAGDTGDQTASCAGATSGDQFGLQLFFDASSTPPGPSGPNFAIGTITH